MSGSSGANFRSGSGGYRRFDAEDRGDHNRGGIGSRRDRHPLGRAGGASSEGGVPIDFAVKRHAGATYLFAAAMREGEASAAFSVPNTRDARVELLGEGRAIDAVGGRWENRF